MNSVPGTTSSFWMSQPTTWIVSPSVRLPTPFVILQAEFFWFPICDAPWPLQRLSQFHHLDFTTALCSEKWVVDNGQLQAIGSPDEYFKGEADRPFLTNTQFPWIWKSLVWTCKLIWHLFSQLTNVSHPEITNFSKFFLPKWCPNFEFKIGFAKKIEVWIRTMLNRLMRLLTEPATPSRLTPPRRPAFPARKNCRPRRWRPQHGPVAFRSLKQFQMSFYAPVWQV